ncbi:hypothetical protein [Haloactinopolyspora alba]|nr:hypothetical protein [Haloactinopolyspora alba]
MRHGFACAGDGAGAGDEMVATFEGLSDHEHVVAFNLARRVIIEALSAARPEGMTDDDFTTLGANMAKTMAWADLEPNGVQTFLREVWHGQPYSTDEADTFGLAIVCGGYLVVGLAPDGDWSTFLDTLLDRIVFPDGTAQ